MEGELFNSAGENIERYGPDKNTLEQIAQKHKLNARETNLFIQNISMVTTGIIEFSEADDPEDGRESLDIWSLTLDMYLSMAPKIGPAIAEALEPIAQRMEPNDRRKRRR